jgi:hypothetical protein
MYPELCISCFCHFINIRVCRQAHSLFRGLVCVQIYESYLDPLSILTLPGKLKYSLLHNFPKGTLSSVLRLQSKINKQTPRPGSARELYRPGLNAQEIKLDVVFDVCVYLEASKPRYNCNLFRHKQLTSSPKGTKKRGN